MLEGYVLTPNVQRRSVSLPPALTIAAQVLLGVLLGALGSPWRRRSPPPGWSRSTGSYVEEVLEDDEPRESTASRTRPRAAAD